MTPAALARLDPRAAGYGNRMTALRDGRLVDDVRAPEHRVV